MSGDLERVFIVDHNGRIEIRVDPLHRRLGRKGGALG